MSVSVRPRAALLALLACLAPVTARCGIDVLKDVRYGLLPEQLLDVCLPPRNAPHPGVVFLHGGGWMSGDQKEFAVTCPFMASLGFVAASIAYRLAKVDNPATRWPAQLADSQLALQWLREHSAELG